MSSSKEIDLLRDFAAGGYLPEAQKPKPTLTHCILVFTRKGGEEGELNRRKRERGNAGEYRSQRWVENANLTQCTPEIDYKL
jgi:hypothetical protein